MVAGLAAFSVPQAVAAPVGNGKLAFDDGSEIYTINPDGSGLATLTDTPAPYVSSRPRWSPDGTKITFQTNRDDGNWEIYVMDADGSNQVNLTNSATTETGPSFTADGSAILYHNDNRLDSVPVAGGSPTTILSSISGVDAFDPADSPDGTKLVVSNLQSDLWLYDYLTSTLTRLTFNSGFTYNPAWSPDGTRIYFQHLVGGSWKIQSIRPDGTDLQDVVTGNGIEPAPSPDGGQLAFMRTGSGLYIADANGASEAAVAGRTGSHFGLSWQAVSAGSGTGGTLDGVADLTGASGVDLTAAGTEDWAVWGYGTSADGGCVPLPAESGGAIAPSVRKAGGNLISDLTNAQGTAAFVDCYGPANPFSFSWTNGDPTAPTSTAEYVGISHSSHDVGDEFAFSVPASTTARQVKVWLYSDGGEGMLTAHLSDESAADYTYVLPAGGTNNPLVVTLDYSAPNAGARLQVSWKLTSAAPPSDPAAGFENAAVFAVALSGGTGGGGGALQIGPDYVVNTTDDHDDAECTDTDCTLREAIDAANDHPNAGIVPDVIEFDLPGAPPYVISAIGGAFTPGLPAITEAVVIDGATQPGYAGTPLIRIDGGGSTSENGFTVLGGVGTTIRGFSITGFGDGISAQAPVTIEGNYIGLLPDGATASANGTGITFGGGGSGTVGGTTAAARNVISGNAQSGIYMSAEGITIAGNYIGTDATGALDRGNGEQGVEGSDPGAVTIGLPGSGNVISGNTLNGVYFNAAYQPVVVQANAIGTNEARTAAIPNGGDGVRILQADDAVVGAGSESDGNLVRGNTGSGIVVEASTGVTVQHNRVEQNGTAGIRFDDAYQSTVARNTVTGNGGSGIGIVGTSPGTGNRITRNSIDDNAGLGIDLGDDGVTANDAFPDADTGPNTLQNFPLVSSAVANGLDLAIDYNVPGAAENEDFTVEFFASPAPDASGNGEGLRYLGTDSITVGVGGPPSVDFADAGVSVGEVVSATATDASGNTSEFSLAVPITNDPVELTLMPEADAQVSSEFASLNYGSSTTADVYGGFNPSCVPYSQPVYSLLRFDLGAIPAGAAITGVRLETTTRAGWAQDGDPAHWAIAIEDDSWDESTVTWNNRPDDGIPSPEDTSVRTSTRALGAAAVYRATCGNLSPNDDRATIFPSFDDGGIKSVAAQASDFIDTVAAARANPDDGKLSVELWTPNCPVCSVGSDLAYWARYYTKEAADPAVRPRLVVTYDVSAGPPVPSVTLDADTDTPEAGAAEVPLVNVPPSAILDASRVVAAPLSDTPLADTPLADTPLADIPLADIGFGDVAGLLNTVSLSTLPLKREGGWPALLGRLGAESPQDPTVPALVEKQLQQITLGDLYALSPRPSELDPARPLGGPDDDITLSELDLTNSPLGGLNTLDVILGSTLLSEVGVPDPTPDANLDPLDAWCEILAGAPISCSTPTDLAGASIISTALRGAPLSDTPLADTPLSDIPLSDIPLADTPLSDTPLADIPLSDTGLTGIPLADTPLSDIPLSDIPLADIPLADTPLADIPLADTPLADTPLSDVPLSDIDIARFPLSDIPLSDVPLSDTPLADIPLSDVAQPGAIFVGTCEALTIGDPACTLRPGLDYGDVLGALSPSARILVNKFVAAVDAKGKLGPDDTLGELLNSLSIPVYQSFLALPEFQALVYPGTTNPLPGLTVEGLIEIVKNASNAKRTLADLLAILIKSDTLGWEKLDLKQARVQEVSTKGGEVEYTARLGLSAAPGGATGTSETLVTVTLPDGFSYLPGSATYGPDGPATPIADPTISGRVLTWTFDIGIDADFQNLVFRVRPGLRLGPAETSIDVTPLGGDTANATKSVSVGDTFENNDTILQAAPLNADSFFLSYLTSASDVDMFSFPVPAEAGARVTFRLSHVPADYDIVVYGPAGQILRPSPAATPPLDGVGIADEGASLQSVTDGLAPQPLDDVPLVQDEAVLGVSTLRGIQDDGVTVVSNGIPGTYTVQVTGFNGAFSNEAYMLRASVQKPEGATPTTTRSVTGGDPAAQLVLGVDSPEVNTVFVVDREQFTGLYDDGAAAISSIVGNLGALASLGYPAVVLQVDAGDGTPVDDAMAAWNADPGSSVLANNAVREISAVVDTFRETHPAVANVVLIGPDAAMPFARLDDLTTQANEKGYASTFPADSEIAASLAAGKVLSDDPYGDDNPQNFLGRQLYLPDIAVGRLVETPTDIQGAVQRFVDYGGQLDASTALATGYSFLSDSAEVIADSLQGRIPTTARLNDDNWTKSDLVTAFFGGSGIPTSITSLNGHASHNAFGPAFGRDLFRVGDLGPFGSTAFDRKLVFSVGCHSGFSVTDVVAGLPNQGDWPQSYQERGGTYIGNTGYGYGDTDVSAYSEEIARIFAANLVKGTMTAGEAMFYAKQEHFGNLGLVSVYDEKASAEMTLYGLPMWKIPGIAPLARTTGPQLMSLVNNGPLAGTSAAGASLFTAASVTDSVTGLDSEEFDVDPSFDPITTDRGVYLEGDDGVQATHYRPIQPKKVIELESTDVHGALIEELTSSDQDGVDPVFQRPLVDDPAIEPELPYDDLAFPSKIQTVTTLLKPGPGGPELKKNLVLVTGQFFGDGELEEDGIGIQRRFTKIGGRAYISASDDYTPATFEKIDAVKTDGAVTFSVELSEGSSMMKRVLVGYLEEDPDATGERTWTFVDLVPDGPNSKRWIKTINTPAERVQFFAQSVDANGNVGVTTNKALFYAGEPAPTPEPGGVAPLLNGAAPPPNPIFGGPVEVGATTEGDGTAQISVSGPQSSGGFVEPPFTASADGVYTVVVEGSDGSTASTSFVIDTRGPIIDLTGPPSPTNDATPTFTFSGSEPAEFSCKVDGGSYVSCSEPSFTAGPLADGEYTFFVYGIDGQGNGGVGEAVSVEFVIDTTAPVTEIVSGPTGPTPSTSAAFVLGPVGATFECKLDSGSFAACSTPANYSSLSQGEHTLTVQATDEAGNTDPTPEVRAWVVDTIAPDTMIDVKPANPTNQTTSSFTFSATEGTVTFTCQLDGAPAFTACSASYPTSPGSHTLNVRATDAAGNVDPTPATYTWFVDTTLPVASIDTGPSPTVPSNTRTATFAFSTNEPGAGSLFECKLDAEAFSTCTSPHALTVPSDGPHTFTVQAKDAAGNVSLPVSRTWSVDTNLPSVSIDFSGPTTSVPRNAVLSVTVTCTDEGAPLGGSGCTAALTPPSGSPTSSVPTGAPFVLPTVNEGLYTINATATDAAGNAFPYAATYTVGTSATGTIVFARGGDIWLIKPDGTGLRQITSGPAIDEQPVKTPAGDRIVFARGAAGSRQLYRVDPDGSNLVGPLTSGGDNTAPAFNPANGTQIAFESTRSGSKGRDIWTATFSPTGATLTSYANRTNAKENDLTPVWSPNGARIAFSSNRNEKKHEIFTMTATGGNVIKLTNNRKSDLDPTYSPDGLRIAYSSNQGTGGPGNKQEIFSMLSSNGGSVQRLTTLLGFDRAPLYLDSSRIVFQSMTIGGLAIVPATGGAPVKITNTIFGDATPG